MGASYFRNDSAPGVLKHHYVTITLKHHQGVRETQIGNLRLLIQNSLNELFCYIDTKESCLFVAEIIEPLDLNTSGRPDGLPTVFFTPG